MRFTRSPDYPMKCLVGSLIALSWAVLTLRPSSTRDGSLMNHYTSGSVVHRCGNRLSNMHKFMPKNPSTYLKVTRTIIALSPKQNLHDAITSVEQCLRSVNKSRTNVP